MLRVIAPQSRAAIIRECFTRIPVLEEVTEEIDILRIGTIVHLGKSYSPGDWVFCATWEDNLLSPATIQEILCVQGQYFVAVQCYPSRCMSLGKNGVSCFDPPIGPPQCRVAPLFEWVSLLPMWEVGKGEHPGQKQFLVINW